MHVCVCVRARATAREPVPGACGAGWLNTSMPCTPSSTPSRPSTASFRTPPHTTFPNPRRLVNQPASQLQRPYPAPSHLCMRLRACASRACVCFVCVCVCLYVCACVRVALCLSARARSRAVVCACVCARAREHPAERGGWSGAGRVGGWRCPRAVPRGALRSRAAPPAVQPRHTGPSPL